MSTVRYSYEFKIMCVDLYRQNRELPTPDTTTRNNFRGTVSYWSRLVDANGVEVLKPSVKYKFWDPKEELFLVNQVLSGKNMSQVAIENGLTKSQVKRCVQIYETEGYIGLVKHTHKKPVKHTRKKPVKEPRMNSKNRKNVDPLTMSEREELKFLREENERIKAEIAIIKKLDALRREKWESRLKAKKQQQLNNLLNRDIS